MRRTRPRDPHHRPQALLSLFPEIMPYSTGFLDVSGGHTLYWEQCGNPDGVPIVFLHGGPGGGIKPVHRRFFDPDHYRIILFDQRGAGRSHPHAGIEHNTLALLIDDIEKVRAHLGIEHWHIFGGSWGSTLGLAYAQAFPQRPLSLILRGIFLMEEPEIDWFMNGIRVIFPEAWEQFTAVIPLAERGDMLTAFYKRLCNPDPQIHLEAAIAWSLYEGACSSLLPNYETITTDDQKKNALALARIEAHYFATQMMTPKTSLMNGIDKIRAIPAVIIQGRYDVICPLVTAHRLHLAWPEADYIVVPDGGHSALDPPIRSRLIEATENMKTIR